MEKKKFDVEFHGTNLFALVPLLLFVVFCILFFVVFKTFDMMHLCMGGYVALIIGSLLSKNWGKYWDAVATGMSSKIMNELALILLIVGMFGKLMTRGGVAQGFVWLGDKIGLSGGGFVAFTFIATCVIATATGTSIGTMFTAFPILYPSGLLLGADPVFLAGAILSGAIFGDNVGPISDTTIASASTQEYTNKPGVADVAGVVGSRMKYTLVAAAAATVCFALFGGSGSAINAAEAEAILAQYSNPKGLIMLIPVAILLIVAFIKRNIYVACTWGLISGTIIGLVSGILVPSDIMGMQDGTLGGFLIDGVNNMIGTVGYLYAIAGIIGILNASGLLQQVIDGLVHSKLNRSVVGTEVIISVGLMVSSICLGSANGPAIIMWGPIANDLGKSKGLHPYRRANLMDGFGSTLPAVIPVTSAFIFIALSCIQGLMDTYSFVQEVSPVSLAGASLHCWFLFVALAVAVITGKKPPLDMSVVPSCVYTTPEIASVGLTEENAKANGIVVKSGKYLTGANGKCLIEGTESGYVKLVTDKENGRILGAQLVCPRATDMVGELTLAIQKGLTAADLSEVIHPHPTFSEMLFGAAEGLRPE